MTARHLYLVPAPAARACISWCVITDPHEVCEADPIAYPGGQIRLAVGPDGAPVLSIYPDDCHGIDIVPLDAAADLAAALTLMTAKARNAA